MVDILIRNCDAILYEKDVPNVVRHIDIAIKGSKIQKIAKTGSFKITEESKVIEAVSYTHLRAHET